MSHRKFGRNIESEAVVVADEVHERVHRGQVFTFDYKSVDASPIADNASINVLIGVRDDPLHCVFRFVGGGDFEYFLFESPTVTNVGTVVPIRNLNRYQGSTWPKARVWHTPTTSNDGTQLQGQWAPNLLGGSQETRADTEWILQPNTRYLIRLTNRQGTAEPMGVEGVIYESASS